MRKLYYEDVHMTDFEAKVVSCSAMSSGLYETVLDQTAFFPEEGGQSADKGTINGEDVLDVQISGDTIRHILRRPFEVGSTVRGHVDWNRRFDFMQQHSGEHIVSGLVHAAYGYDNVGFHLGLTDVTMDFNGPLSREQAKEIESDANRAVWDDLPVLITYPTPEELSHLTYRSKLDLTEDVRIVEIPGVDVCACCAPHVDTTGQIGMIKITDITTHRGGVRVNILCGNRALEDFRRKQESVSGISAMLSAKPDEIEAAVSRVSDEVTVWKQKYNTLQAKMLEMETLTLPSPEDTKNAILFVQEADNIAVRNTVNSLCERYSGFCAVFVGEDGSGYRFIIGSKNEDCRNLATQMRSNFGAKGGGTPPMIQGSINARKESIREFFDAM